LFRQAGYVQSIKFELYKADGTFVRTWSPSSIESLSGTFPIPLAWNSSFTGTGITQFKVRLTFLRTNPSGEREPALPTEFYVQNFTLFKLVNAAASTLELLPNLKGVFSCNNNGSEVNKDSLFDGCEFRNCRERSGIVFNFPDVVDTPAELMQNATITNCQAWNTGSLLMASGLYKAFIANNIADSTYLYDGNVTDRLGDPYDGQSFYNYGVRVKNIGGTQWDKYVFSNNTLIGGHWAFECTPNTYRSRSSSDRLNMGGVFINNTISGVNAAVSLTMQKNTFVSNNTLRTVQGFGGYGLELAKDLIDCTVSNNVIDLGFSLNGNCVIGGQASKTKGFFRISGNTLIGTSGISKFTANAQDPADNGGGDALDIDISNNYIRCSLFGVRGFGGNAIIKGNTFVRFEVPTQIEQSNLGTKTILLEDRDTNVDGQLPLISKY